MRWKPRLASCAEISAARSADFASTTIACGPQPIMLMQWARQNSRAESNQGGFLEREKRDTKELYAGLTPLLPVLVLFPPLLGSGPAIPGAVYRRRSGWPKVHRAGRPFALRTLTPRAADGSPAVVSDELLSYLSTIHCSLLTDFAPAPLVLDADTAAPRRALPPAPADAASRSASPRHALLHTGPNRTSSRRAHRCEIPGSGNSNFLPAVFSIVREYPPKQ
jgi:hypothetical protein